MNNPFAMFSAITDNNVVDVANNVVGNVDTVNFADALMDGGLLGRGRLGQLGRVAGKFAAPVAATSAIAFAYVSRLSIILFLVSLDLFWIAAIRFSYIYLLTHVRMHIHTSLIARIPPLR